MFKEEKPISSSMSLYSLKLQTYECVPLKRLNMLIHAYVLWVSEDEWTGSLTGIEFPHHSSCLTPTN